MPFKINFLRLKSLKTETFYLKVLELAILKHIILLKLRNEI